MVGSDNTIARDSPNTTDFAPDYDKVCSGVEDTPALSLFEQLRCGSGSMDQLKRDTDDGEPV